MQKYSTMLEELFNIVEQMHGDQNSQSAHMNTNGSQVSKGDQKRKRIQVGQQADKKFRKLVRDLGEQFDQVKRDYQNNGE